VLSPLRNDDRTRSAGPPGAASDGVSPGIPQRDGPRAPVGRWCRQRWISWSHARPPPRSTPRRAGCSRSGAAGRAGGLPGGSRRPFRARRRPPAPAAPAALSRPRTQLSGSATTGPGWRQLLDHNLGRGHRGRGRAGPARPGAVPGDPDGGDPDRGWRAAAVAAGRGLHSTATGRMLAGMFAALRDASRPRRRRGSARRRVPARPVPGRPRAGGV